MTTNPNFPRGPIGEFDFGDDPIARQAVERLAAVEQQQMQEQEAPEPQVEMISEAPAITATLETGSLQEYRENRKRREYEAALTVHLDYYTKGVVSLRREVQQPSTMTQSQFAEAA